MVRAQRTAALRRQFTTPFADVSAAIPLIAARRAPLRGTQLSPSDSMSRAFVNEDAGGGRQFRRFALPPRSDPSFDEHAARALIEGAIGADTESAEQATGYYWGEVRLRPHVERLLARARAEDDRDVIRAAERFLR